MDVGIQAIGELAGVSSEGAHQVTMASVEANDYVVQGRQNVVVAQGEDALEHHTRSGLLKLEALLAGHEEAGDHPRRVGRDPLRVAGGEPGAHQSHCGTSEKRCACCRVEITARVDSAPWLTLTHSASNPSKPPPVSESHMTNPESLAPWNQAAHDRIPSGQSARGSAAEARAQASARVATSIGFWSKAGRLSCGPRPPTGGGDRWPSFVSYSSSHSSKSRPRCFRSGSSSATPAAIIASGRIAFA